LPVKAVDSSVVIAAFATWHEHHGIARTAMVSRPRLIAYAAIESYSVLTRLPRRTGPTRRSRMLSSPSGSPNHSSPCQKPDNYQFSISCSHKSRFRPSTGPQVCQYDTSPAQLQFSNLVMLT
jgi:hypothetical protein